MVKVMKMGELGILYNTTQTFAATNYTERQLTVIANGGTVLVQTVMRDGRLVNIPNGLITTDTSIAIIHRKALRITPTGGAEYELI
jgi:hypothetical protein